MTEPTSPGASGIAIIGMAGRFPGAPDLEAFWRNLRDGVEAITFFTDEEAARRAADPSLLSNPAFVKAEPLLDGGKLFDAGFFEIPPREAELLDPQHRLLLECAWEALENAGYAPGRIQGSVGVYTGCAINHYLLNNLLTNPQVIRSVPALQLTVASDKDYLSTRISYKLDLRGPSVGVQTACSTSLVAVHLASQALLDYHCDMALAGGISIKPDGRAGYLYEPGGIVSPDGHCRAFDHRANGTVFGSGFGLVVLKRLDEALADGDPILAVIRGSAVANDGSVKPGYTSPGVDGQVAVISEALAVAEVDPESITFVEAHGTATPMGDPIEVTALTRVFRATTQERGFCALGSVKTGIGHLDSAGGIAALIKTVLALQNRQIPPSLHFERPNPQLDLEASPFYVNADLRDWPEGPEPRRAGVSSFGIGGTNAHVVLEEAPPPAPREPASRPWQLLALSARTETALAAAAERLAAHLRSHPEVDLADAAWTLQAGRARFAHRRAVVARDAAEAVAALAAPDPRPAAGPLDETVDRSAAFFFPGPGAQVSDQGAGLYRSERAFREAFDRCADLAAPLLGSDLRRVVISGGEGATVDLRHAARFAVDYALAQQWIAWGVRPQVLLGHGVGEYVAACLAGVFSLEDALRLVIGRGQLLQRLREGSDAAAMEPILEPFRRLVAGVRLAAPRIPLVVSVSGTWIRPEQATDPEHWVAHLRQPARLEEALEALAGGDGAVVVEVGLPAGGGPEAEVPFLLRALGELWAQGIEPDWSALHAPARRRRIALPTYPFERQTFWIERGGPMVAEPAPAPAAGERRRDPADWFHVPSWRRVPRPQTAEPAARATWLLLARPGGPGEALAGALSGRGEVVTVVPGETFARSGAGSYTVRPDRAEDYEALLRELDAAGREPDRIVHLFTAGDGPGELAELETLGFYSLVALGQALGRRDVTPAFELAVVSSGLWEVDGRERLAPAKALLLGPCQAIPRELGVRCRCIDVDPGDGELAARLLAELESPAAEPVVALRGRHRWAQSHEPVRLEAPLGRTVLRERGTWLITGGPGTPGLRFAEHLARRAAARLILVDGSADPRKLQELEAAGAEVMVASADVTDEAAMAGLLAEARSRFGPVHGAFHAAGAPAGGPLLAQTREELAAALAARVRGTLVLDRLLRNEPLEFFLLASSTAAFAGGPAGTVAADAFLDAFAHQRWAEGGLRALAVGWSGQEAEEGAAALERVLASGLGPQVVVAPAGLEALRREPALPAGDRGANGAARPGGTGRRYPRPSLSVPYAPPRNELEALLVDLWGELLGIDQVGIDDNFFEIGGHSLLAIELATRLRETLHIDLRLDRLFAARTVAELAQVIVQVITEQVDSDTLSLALAELDEAPADGRG